MSALLELAEQCEKATAPDRQLDAAIGVAIGDDKTACVALPQFHGPGMIEGAMWFYPALEYTASLDAALALVPEDIGAGEGDGWYVQVCRGYRRTWSASVSPPWNDTENNRRAFRSAGDECTPALALCAAALRARAASADTHPKGGDGEATAPFMGGAVPNDSEADAHD